MTDYTKIKKSELIKIADELEEELKIDGYRPTADLTPDAKIAAHLAYCKKSDRLDFIDAIIAGLDDPQDTHESYYGETEAELKARFAEEWARKA